VTLVPDTLLVMTYHMVEPITGLVIRKIALVPHDREQSQRKG
jgi:hypothetical protein